MPLWNKNVNCLESKRCPKCGYDDEIIVSAMMRVSLTDDGTDPYGDNVHQNDVEYNDDSYAKCPECEYEGKLKEWNIKEEKHE